MASSKNHPIVCPTLTILLILGCCGVAWAVEFAGGTGEPNDPYQIATAEQLIGISSDRTLYDRHFVLVADIDLDPALPGCKIFEGPVIEWIVPKTRAGQDGLLHGSFDGGGHVIRNCVIFKASSQYYAALIGQVAEEGVVRAVHLENMLIVEQKGSASTYYYCGALAAVNYGAVIDCSATGTLTAYQAGGLIGRNAGIVARCHADCNIFGDTVGGLTATNDAAGRIVLCRSSGLVYGEWQTGCLVAANSGTIQYCTTNAYVSGIQTGGLVGENRGWIREAFCTATAVGAGIASTNYGTIVNCYATGLMSAYSDGLVVWNQGTIQSSYSTTASQVRRTTVRRSLSPDLTIASYASGTVRCVYYLDTAKLPGLTYDPYSDYGVPLSAEEMKQQASFVGFDFYGDANDGPAGHWFMTPDAYPVLTWQTEITGLTGVPDVSGLTPEQAELVLKAAGFEPNGVQYDYARLQTIGAGRYGDVTREVGAKGQVIATQPSGYLPAGSPVAIVVSLGLYDFNDNPGDGSEANPYQIATPSQLDSLCGQFIDEDHYILTADIDMGVYVYVGALINGIACEFNGNGHTIHRLQTGASPQGSFGGLVGIVAPSGSVHDLTVDEATATGGILAGENRGQVLRCTATGQVTAGYSYTGGLVGSNVSGQLIGCQFSGRVQADLSNSPVGGLVGDNTGSISGCCADDVEVLGSTHVGGLVGQNHGGAARIEASCARGRVSGNSMVGGLLGRNGHPRLNPRTGSLIDIEPGLVQNCYAACLVTGQTDVGGCIGFQDPNGAQESCFFLVATDGGGPDNGLGMLLTAEQMTQQASFVDWDFIDTWTICGGKDYPRLRWEGVECEE